MSIMLFDPVGELQAVYGKNERQLASLKGKRVAYIFNQHIAAVSFWEELEREVQNKLQPSSVYRVYKTQSWKSTPQAELDHVIQETDYALIGVGA